MKKKLTNFIETILHSIEFFNRQKFGTNWRREATRTTAQRTRAQTRRTRGATLKGNRQQFSSVSMHSCWIPLWCIFVLGFVCACVRIIFCVQQKERDAREARLLDREIRAQERHNQIELKKHKEAVAAAAELQKQASQVHTQLSQLSKHVPGSPSAATRSPRESIDKSDGKSRLSHHDLKQKSEALATTSASTSSAVCHLLLLSYAFHLCCWNKKMLNFFFTFNQILMKLFCQDPKSQGGQSTSAVDTGVIAAAGQPIPLAALATVAPILPFGVTTLRDDSTESDQSLVGSQPQSEAYQRFL